MVSSGLFIFILGIASAVALIHMFAPDHWIPLLAVSSRSNYTRRRTYATAATLGFFHALSSIAVALVAFSISMTVAEKYVHFFRLGAEILLIIIAIYFVINGMTEKNSGESDKPVSNGSLLSVSVFPDMAFMPLLISAVGLPELQILTIVVLFAAVSIFSLTFVVFFSLKGLLRAIKNMPPRYMDYTIGIVLVLTALYLYFI
ncbi:MAG: hypothetical protein ACP5UV_06205 [Thermoplasmata archaeon]